MKATKMLTILVLALGLMVCLSRVSEAVPMGTAFTYQARLMDANFPADGLYDLQFKLFDANVAGNQLASTIDIDDLEVIDGYFGVELDFGSSVFDGNAVWLETRVVESPIGSDPCTLSPRVQLTPMPYALHTRGIFVDDACNVGIGTTTPEQKLTVVDGTIKCTNSNIGGWAVHGEASGWYGQGIYGYGTAFGGRGVYGKAGEDLGMGVYGRAIAEGQVTNYGGYFLAAGDWGLGVYGTATATGSVTNCGGYFKAAGDSGEAVRGKATATGEVTNYGGYFEAAGSSGRGVYSEASASPGSGIVNYGGYFVAKGGRGKGVYGEASNTGDFINEGGRFAAQGRYSRGVSGNSTGSDGKGVYGLASASSGTNYGVYGQTYSSTGYAGYFKGRVHITGTLSKGGGSFKIDHPLEPENKYLQHSFIESPDMMNVYNGNVLLDEKGEACVQLPNYFEALNRDFRYQLTCIGGFAPVYIAEKISGNSFKVAGGKKEMEVSWQVTGIRQDAYAKANRIVVEEDKSVEDRGYYLHPTAYGLPEEKGIEAERNAQFSETRQVAKNESR